MAVYTWPTTAAHPWYAERMALRVFHNNRQNVSPLNGFTQTLALPGARWGWTLDFPEHTYAERAELEGFIARLNGNEHRLALWDFARPTPRGSIALTGVTAASAVQFASSLVLAGCRPRNNLLLRSQEFDNAAWVKQNCTVTASGTTDPLGGSTAERIVEDAVAGVGRYVAQSNAWVAGTTYVISAHFREVTAGLKRYAGILVPAAVMGSNTGVQWDIATGTATATAGTVLASGTQALSNSWRRVWCAVTAVNSVSSGAQFRFDDAASNIGGTWDGDGTSGMHIWGAQVEVASTPSAHVPFAQLLAGDWLSLPIAGGAQLLMVAENATANGGGAMTVPVRHMLRGAVSGGAAVTLDRPTGLFVLANPAQDWPRSGSNRTPAASVELVEVFG